MEQLLHYVWKHKIFPLKVLYTTSDEPVEVIDPGLPNTNAGPDFFNAKIKIGDTLWVGNVEIHMKSSDWLRHGHSENIVYDSVILHVAEVVDQEIRRTTGELIPQMQLSCPADVVLHYDELCRTEIYPPCYSILPSLSKFTIHSWLSVLQVERFEEKRIQLLKRLESCNNNWEDAFFITLARSFGFGLNGDTFETWAKSLSLRAIDKHRDNLFQVEAFFFGQAGLLEQRSDEYSKYYADLQKEYAYLSHKFSLSPSMDYRQWRFLRLRPDNFPHIRLAQLAYLYSSGQTIFSHVMDAETLGATRDCLRCATSDFWESHFNFNKVSPKRKKQLGDHSLDLIIINTVIPFLYAYGIHKSEDRLCDRASHFLDELKAENNYVTRMWSNAGLPVSTAADSQALLQLQKFYCDKKDCLRCRFGYEYLKHR